MKILFKVIFLVISISFFFLGFPQTVNAESLTNITVKVEHNKANGESWDTLKGKPDLAICLSNSLTGTLCLPEGDRASNILSSQCPNSYQCKFSVLVPDKTFKFSVVDVDAIANDPIGTGHCDLGKTCQVGQAKISVGTV